MTLSARLADAYPSFIGYGYTSCVVCHANAFGGGPLTDYGRALGAVAIAAKPFWNSKISDEELGKRALFFQGPNPEFVKNLRFQANYRGLHYIANLNNSEARSSRFINMQGDVSVVYQTESRRFGAALNAGFVPPPQGGSSHAQTHKKSPVISREHYVTYMPTENLRTYLGLLDMAFGIRHPDHTMASRIYPGVAMNDQTHGLAVHYTRSSGELGLHGFLGNLYEPVSSIRQKGVSLIYEHDVLEKFRLGASLLYSASEVRKRMGGAVHGRLGVGHGSAILGEIGLIRTALIDDEATYGAYIWGQSTVRVMRGLNILFTAEASSRDAFSPSVHSLKAGPSIQYFPTGRIELRSDLWVYRVFGDPRGAQPDDFRLNTQVHLWY